MVGILVVDHDAACLSSLQHLLQVAGHEVCTASNITEACKQFDARTDLDLVISGECFEDGSGTDFLNKVVKMGKSAILETGRLSLVVPGQRRPEGLDERIGFFYKPFEPQAMLDKITQLTLQYA